MKSFLVGTAIMLVLGGSQSIGWAVSLLAIDVNDRTVVDSPNTVTGFESFVLTATGTPTTQTFGAYTVTLAPWDDGTDGDPAGAIDDRDRDVPNNSGALTYAQIYDDFVFATTSVGLSGGIDLMVSGGSLQPNTAYAVSIYSYDGGAVSGTTRRTATWYDRNANDAVVLTTDWIDDVAPTSNETYRFDGAVTTDSSGKLFLRGRGNPPDLSQVPPRNNGPPVYINGFEIESFEPPSELTLEVNTTTGSVRFLNEQSVNFDMNYYEIRSASGALHLAGWTSLDDAEGGDPIGTGWDEAPNSDANLLSEVNLTSLQTFPPATSANLGSAFTVGGGQDLQFLYADPSDSTLRTGFVKYVTGGIQGDYNGNGVVDAADYTVWRDHLGQTVPEGTGADGNGDGTVNPADYAAWKSNFGESGPGNATAAVVPEPIAVGISSMAALLACCNGRILPRQR